MFEAADCPYNLAAEVVAMTSELTIGLNPIEVAYFRLLTLNPADDFRISNQDIYARLRDYIAEEWQWDSERIQNHFEGLARQYYASEYSDD